MQVSLKKSLQILSIFLLIGASSAWADGEVKGRIEAVNQNDKSIVVDGITFYVTNDTDYHGGLQIFADLLKEQKVEIDYLYQNHKHIAVEIEFDD
jgi:hypothetical protein